jgi:hypothetical protein
MNPVSNNLINEKLGVWQGSLSNSILLTLEETNTNLKYFVSNDLENVRVFLRPFGLQLINIEVNDKMKNFALEFNDIKLVELFPSKVYSNKTSSNLFLTIFIGFLFMVFGYAFAEQLGALIWFPCGLVFGSFFSSKIGFTRKRGTLKISLLNGDYFVFSVKEKYLEPLSDLFKTNIGSFVIY